MKSLRRFLVVLSVAILITFAGNASANILLNPGFEIGSGADAADWAEITAGPSGSTARDSGMPSSGGFAAHMSFDHITNQAAGGAYFIEQNQGANVIDNTDTFDLTFDAKADSTTFTGTDMFYQILWLDQDASHGGGVKGETLTSLVGAGISTSYQTFSLLNIDVPDGADSFLLRFQISAGAVDGVANGLWVDNASLAVVGGVIPEPASLGLFVTGGLLTLARRRRK
jgi:PEP-CTERM motif